MPSIRGLFGRVLVRNEYTSATVFIIHTEDPRVPEENRGILKCRGKIPLFPKGAPVILHFEESDFLNTESPYDCITDDCRLDPEQKQAMSDFISENRFPGIGKARAEKIMAQISDLAGLLSEENAKEQLMAFGLTDFEASQFMNRMSAMLMASDLYEEIYPYGGTLRMASTVAEIFGAKTMETLEKDPYRLCKVGVPFSICDQIAKHKGFSPYMHSRLSAMTEAVLCTAESAGHTKMSLSWFFRQIRKLEFQAGTGYETSPMHFVRALFDEKYTLFREDGVYYVYRTKTFRMEQEIANDIMRTGAITRPIPVTDRMIHETEEALQITYSEEQKAAFHLLDTSGVKILTGGPGTGKTTVMNGLIRVFETLYPEKRIELCAPTGCAAKRMREATGKNARTIHKLLDIRPRGDGNPVQMKDEYDRLDVDLLIVDESSMMGIDIFSRLIRALPNSATILLSGDEDQLASVEAGNVLHDLLHSGSIEHCRLRQIYRQENGSSLAENSIRIRDGQSALILDENFQIIECANEQDMMKAALIAYRTEAQDYGIRNVRMFSPIRKAAYLNGTFNLNRAIKKMRGQMPDDDCLYGMTRFTKGDLVIFLRNNYAAGYMNGDIGVIRSIEKGERGSLLTIETDDGDVMVSGSDLDDIDLGYALTVHKAQGGECDSAIILLPPQPAHMLSRSLLYVAATRAKKKNILITMPGTLQTALNNVCDRRRDTGLLYRMAQISQS